MGQQSWATTETGFIATRIISIGEIEAFPHSSRKRSLSWANRIISGVALAGLSLSLLANCKAEAISITFEKIVDTNTPIPGGTGNLESFINPSLDNGNVAFWGHDFDSKQEGIFTSIDGKLDVIYEKGVYIVDSALEVHRVSYPSLDDRNVAFTHFGEESSNTLPSIDGDIYTSIDGKLNVVVAKNTPIPGGTGNFESFQEVSLDNGNVAFVGSGEKSSGIYTSIGGKLNVIADTNTPIPGGTGNFESFREVSLDNGNVAFLGIWQIATDRGGTQSGVYTNLGGTLAKIVATGDRLDGKKIFDVSFGREGLSGNQIAFSAQFEDGPTGIYIATVPEPASVQGTLPFGTFGTGWVLKQRQKAKVDQSY